MNREKDRLHTFDNKWPHDFLTKEVLAKNGFYFLGRGDEVRCAFCKVEIMKWENGDDPAVDHKRWAAQCPLVNGRDTDNIPLDRTVKDEEKEFFLQNEEILRQGSDECGTSAPVESSEEELIQQNHERGVCTAKLTGPAHPAYASLDARLASFKDWPKNMGRNVENLVEAGFFYTGKGDQTKCFYCNGGLKDWDHEDIPWEQHAQWFDKCAFVKLLKGDAYIQRVKTEACSITSQNEPVEHIVKKEYSTEEITNLHTNSDSNMCKICLERERTVCFYPCKHIVTCEMCALTSKTCCVCRSTISKVEKVYLS
jgi:hypothetical protein